MYVGSVYIFRVVVGDRSAILLSLKELKLLPSHNNFKELNNLPEEVCAE